MKHTNIDEYCFLMSNVDLPDRVRDSVMREARRAESGSLSRKTVSQQTPQRQRRAWRIAMIGACALVLAAGIGIVGNAAMTSSRGQTDTSLVSPGNPNGNFFALAAYATENPETEQGKTVDLDFGYFGLYGGWSSGDPDENGRTRVSCGFSLDLTCTGDNIDSITCSIDGENMSFLIEQRFHSPEELENSAFSQTETDAFTIPYAEQASDKEGMRRTILARFSLDDELQAKYDAYMASLHDPSLSPEETSALSGDFETAILRAYGDMLAQTRFTISAAFADGSTQSKSYVIEPTDDFEQQHRAYRSALLRNQEVLAEDPDAALKEPPSPKLYTITEIVEG